MLDVTVNVFFRQMYVTVEFKVLKFYNSHFSANFSKELRRTGDVRWIVMKFCQTVC